MKIQGFDDQQSKFAIQILLSCSSGSTIVLKKENETRHRIINDEEVMVEWNKSPTVQIINNTVQNPDFIVLDLGCIFINTILQMPKI